MTLRSIWVVDDDADVRSSLKDALETCGPFVVTEAEHGKRALELLDEGKRPDLILLDLAMPVMDGRTFHRELRGRAGLQPPVVVLSATLVRDDPDLRGVRAFLRKPVRIEDLLAALEPAA